MGYALKNFVLQFLILLVCVPLVGCGFAASSIASTTQSTVTVSYPTEQENQYRLPFPTEPGPFVYEGAENYPMEAGGIKVDNDTPLEELLHHSYPLDELLSFFKPFPAYNSGEASLYFYTAWQIERPNTSADQGQIPYYYMDEIIECFPVECFRLNNRHYYIVYRVEEGGFFYVFFNPAYVMTYNPDPNPRMSTAIYINKPIKASAFSEVTIGKTTLQEIAEIDPSLEINFWFSRGPSSYSLLSDGSILVIDYQTKSEEYESFLEKPSMDYRKLYYVTDVTVYLQYPNCALGSLLPQDLPWKGNTEY